MTILTGIIAFATIGNVIVFYYASKDASEQTTRVIDEAGKIATSMEKTVTQAKTAMDASSKQSKASLDSTIENFHLDQRAWVGVSEISPAEYVEGGIKVYVKDGQKIKGEVIIKNTGKTPAFKVRTLITLHYLKSGEKIVIDKKELTTLSASNRIMHPGMTGYLQTSELPGVPNKADIENIVNRRFFVYITAFITYEDVFKRPHFTEYCAVLMPDLGSFGLCKTNNDAN